ncbi:hypothetical protein RUM44_001616 [Polyplax serrata]|uniref:DH domain-containing protein n=1 Tax=Polyplax serrata TaxID=468196 RepID=A0ABR1AKJ1_POLSC
MSTEIKWRKRRKLDSDSRSKAVGIVRVRSRSLTHIDQIEQGERSGIFFQEMSTEKASEQLAVPGNVGSKHRRQMLSRSERFIRNFQNRKFGWENAFLSILGGLPRAFCLFVSASFPHFPTTSPPASSSECFSVGIEGLGEDGNDEFVQASKDTILRDALLDVCRRKGIDLASSNVFLDANKSPLPCLDIDTSWMGGKHIRIKLNDRVTGVKKDQKNSFAPPIKKLSSNYKGGKSGSRTHNVSSEEPSTIEPGPSGKSKRWSGFFGTSRDTSKMETLVDLLDSYTKNGIYEYKEGFIFPPPRQSPAKSRSVTLPARSVEEFPLPEDTYKLESDWKPIVSNAGNLDERQSQQQEAIWELLRSEIDYIKMLRVVSHIYTFGNLNTLQPVHKRRGVTANRCDDDDDDDESDRIDLLPIDRSLTNERTNSQVSKITM